ncbi:MAG: type 4a pilus biogenesis protein PilO [Planctomycetota bacterium]
MGRGALQFTTKVELAAVPEKLTFSFPRGLRLGLAFAAIAGLAGVPIWSSSQLIKARELNARQSAALSERTAACVELSRSERSGEIQQLKDIIHQFERLIPLGQGQNHLRYVITNCAEESGANILTIKLGQEELATLGGDDTFRKLPVTFEAAGSPEAIGKILDKLPSLDRLIAVDQVHMTAAPGGESNATKIALHCRVEAHAYFRTVALGVVVK